MTRNGYTEPNILVEEDTSLSSNRTRIALAALLVILIMGAVCAGTPTLTPSCTSVPPKLDWGSSDLPHGDGVLVRSRCGIEFITV